MPVVGVSTDGTTLVALNWKEPWMLPRNSPAVQRPTGERQAGPVASWETIVPMTARSEAARTPLATCSNAPATTVTSRTFAMDSGRGRVAQRPLDLTSRVVIGIPPHVVMPDSCPGARDGYALEQR